MVYQSFLIKYAEIGTKGKNRFLFEDALIKQIKHALRPVEGKFIISKESGRIYMDAQGEYDYDEVLHGSARCSRLRKRTLRRSRRKLLPM